MEINNFKIIRGTAPVLRFRLTNPENIATWTTKLFVYQSLAANTFFEKAGAISTVAQAATLGILDVTLTANDTNSFPARDYSYAFRRTNVGFEDVLASGRITVVNVG